MLSCTCRELKQHSSVKVISLASPGLSAECVKHRLLTLMSWILGSEICFFGITVEVVFIRYTIQQSTDLIGLVAFKECRYLAQH